MEKFLEIIQSCIIKIYNSRIGNDEKIRIYKMIIDKTNLYLNRLL